jgi:hypothetical protein
LFAISDPRSSHLPTAVRHDPPAPRGRTGFAIAEVGVEWTDDRRSRANPLQDMWKVMREALTIRKNLRRGVYNPLPAAV